MAADGTFHGPFLVRVTRVSSPAPQRLVIGTSDGSDGHHPVSPGQSIPVSGDTWTLELMFFAPEPADPSGWLFSLVQQSVTYTVDEGLVFTLRASNTSGFIGTIPAFDDLVVTVTSTNPDLNPMHPHAPPPDFSLPEGAAGEPGPPAY